VPHLEGEANVFVTLCVRSRIESAHNAHVHRTMQSDLKYRNVPDVPRAATASLQAYVSALTPYVLDAQ